MTPEIRQIEIDYLQDEFVLLACDGLFDVFSSQQVVDFVREKLSDMPIMEQVCFSLHLLTSRILIKLPKNSFWKELAELLPNKSILIISVLF